MIYLLFFLLVIILIISYLFSEKEICAPSFLFSVSFVFCCAWAVTYANVWELDLHIDTFLIVISGVVVFLVVAQVTKYICERAIPDLSTKEESHRIFEIKEWKLIFFIIFEILTIIAYLKCLKTITGGKSIKEAIFIYRMAATQNSNQFFFPRYINYARIVITSASWIFSFVIVKNFLAKRKIGLLILTAFLFSLINSLLAGGRSSLISIVVSVLASFLIISVREQGVRGKIGVKHIIIIIVVGIIGLQMFQRLGNLLGRNSSRDLTEYLSIYCGAEIKNLDIFVRTKMNLVDNSTWGGQTFLSFVRMIKKYTGHADFYMYYDQPHNYVNGKWIGNVATTFYSYLYDFGVAGMLVLTGIMAVISESVYVFAKRIKMNTHPPMVMIIYSMMFVSLVFAFFSNWFYETFATTVFIYNIICWLLLSRFFFTEDIKEKKGI